MPLGREQRAVAAHRPAEQRPRVQAEPGADQLGELLEQDPHPVLAGRTPVPVHLAAVDRRDAIAKARAGW
jgi:hypothetical protein